MSVIIHINFNPWSSIITDWVVFQGGVAIGFGRGTGEVETEDPVNDVVLCCYKDNESEWKKMDGKLIDQADLPAILKAQALLLGIPLQTTIQSIPS